jgi:hypothetical protein
MVTVEKGTSGQWWMMKYNGQNEIVDAEPSESEKTAFRHFVDDKARRDRIRASLPDVDLSTVSVSTLQP